jgi:CBS domain-containing protein
LDWAGPNVTQPAGRSSLPGLVVGGEAGDNTAEGTAGEYMTLEPATVGLETPLGEVARTMLALGVRHLPVVVAGEVLGMVSARDLLELESTTSG